MGTTMKSWAWIWCALLMCCDMHAQSPWKKIPEQARVVHKKLRNTLLSSLYNHELQIEQANVVNNRMLDAEAMRLIGMMPAWKPGTIDGVKVRNRVLVCIWFGDLEQSHFVFEGWYGMP